MLSRLCAVVTLLLCAWMAGAADAEGETAVNPRELIESFHETLITVMQTPTHPERESMMADAVAQSFDLQRIAAVSLGRTWRSMPQEQRSEFVALLGELVSATYADRFDSFANQSFATGEVKELRRGTVVKTTLTKADGGEVALDYFVADGGIFNVVADGVSDLSLRRADYNSIIKQEGYAVLVAHIQGKIAQARGVE